MNISAEVIKQNVSCRQFLESIGVQVNRKGFCCCPLHAERTASMKVYPDGRGWYCFGCGSGGDVITLAQKYYGVDFNEAIKHLAADFGISESAEQRLKASVNSAIAKAMMEKAKRQRMVVELEYWRRFDEWLLNERKILYCRPLEEDGIISDIFRDALHKREYYQDRLDYATMERDKLYAK